jgi:hypothetical protein
VPFLITALTLVKNSDPRKSGGGREGEPYNLTHKKYYYYKTHIEGTFLKAMPFI